MWKSRMHLILMMLAMISNTRRNRNPENIGNWAISSEIPTVYTLVGENEKLIISTMAEQATPVIKSYPRARHREMTMGMKGTICSFHPRKPPRQPKTSIMAHRIFSDPMLSDLARTPATALSRVPVCL